MPIKVRSRIPENLVGCSMPFPEKLGYRTKMLQALGPRIFSTDRRFEARNPRKGTPEENFLARSITWIRCSISVLISGPILEKPLSIWGLFPVICFNLWKFPSLRKVPVFENRMKHIQNSTLLPHSLLSKLSIAWWCYDEFILSY
jgi:hypothetical protein